MEQIYEINIRICNKFFVLISDNYNQMRNMPNELRIAMISSLLMIVGKIIAKLNKFSIHDLINEKANGDIFIHLIRIVLKDLRIQEISSILNFNKNDDFLYLKSRIFKKELIHQDSITSLLVLNKIIFLIEPKINDLDFKRKLKEIKFILDFIFSEDNKYLKLFKHGKSFFNLGSIFKNFTKSREANKQLKEENFLKKLFVILNSFDESNIPLEIELDKMSEENLAFLIQNLFNENLNLNKSSGIEQIKDNVLNDLSKLCDLYLLFFEKEIDSLNENKIDSKYIIKIIDSRLNILEVCIVLLNKKKEFPIFKILSDISLAYFRSIYSKMNFIQICRMLDIYSKDQFVLFYDNSYFALEFYPLIIMNFNKKKYLDNAIDARAFFEIFIYMDKLNYFNRNNYFGNQSEENKNTYKDYLMELKRYFMKNKLHLNLSTKELDIFSFYFDVLLFEIIESGISSMYSDYSKQVLINQANNLFFESNGAKNNLEKIFESLSNYLQYKSLDSNQNLDKSWDKYMNQKLYFFNVQRLDIILSNTLFKKSHLEISFSNPLNQSLTEDLFNLDNSAIYDFNYYDQYVLSNKNKIITKSFIYVLIKFIGMKKEVIEKNLKNIDNKDLYNFIHKIKIK